MKKKITHILMLLLMSVLPGCFTGVESTGHVTERDVQKATAEAAKHATASTLTAWHDSVPAWRPGKQFYVTDDQVRLLFARATDYDVDSIRLAGIILYYDGYDTGSMLDNRPTVNLRFTDRRHTYVYRTDKTMDEFQASYSIPMLVDMDAVHHVARQISGQDLYVKTAIWYDIATDEMLRGRQFIKVHIDSVLPGNKVLPLKVLFTAKDNGDKACLWMTDGNTLMQGRDFDALFSLRDIRRSYSSISDANWRRIVNGQVAEGMTKEECRLAKGAPKSIRQLPDQRGLREYWLYDGGAYLYFVDGILTNNRK